MAHCSWREPTSTLDCTSYDSPESKRADRTRISKTAAEVDHFTAGKLRLEHALSRFAMIATCWCMWRQIYYGRCSLVGISLLLAVLHLVPFIHTNRHSVTRSGARGGVGICRYIFTSVPGQEVKWWLPFCVSYCFHCSCEWDGRQRWYFWNGWLITSRIEAKCSMTGVDE